MPVLGAGTAAGAAVMKPCWRDYGLTEEGASCADRILEAMLALVENAGPDVSVIALREAVFRIRDLPTRSAAYQRKYLKENR